MVEFKLRTKIIFLSVVALIGMSIFAFFNLKQSFDEYSISKGMKNASQLLASASSLVHEMQKERGSSSLFISESMSESDLNDFRRKSDFKIEEFLKVVASSNLKEEQKKTVQEDIEKIKPLRIDVDKKIPVTECIPRYAEIIRSILKIEGAVASLKTTRGVGKLFVNISILEEAKENAGRLRASLSSILAKNQAVDVELLGKVVMLKSGVDSNLGSPALSISEKSKEQLKLLLSSENAQKVNDIFYKVISKSNSGNFSEDPVLFFKTISSFIDGINQIINDEVLSINVQLDSILADTQRSFITVSGISGLFILIVLIIAIKISTSIARIISRLNSETKSIIKAAK